MYRFPLTVYPNQLNLFHQCPFKFRCHQDADVKVPFTETPESFAGKAMHQALRDFFDIKRVPMHYRSAGIIGRLLRQAWGQVVIPVQNGPTLLAEIGPTRGV